MKTIAFLLTIITLSAFIGYSGNEIKNKINPIIVYEPVPYPVVAYITQEVPIVVEREIITEVLSKVQNFESLAELKAWLDGFGIWFVGSTDGASCGVWAQALQKRALNDGYLLNVDIITRAEYNNRFKKMHLKYGVIHAINSAVIGNKIYYIEPQNFEVCHPYYFD